MNDTAFDILMGLLHGPQHGYALLKHIETMHEGKYSPGPGLLYTTLKKLLDQQMIVEAGSVDNKKLYELTDGGRQAFQQALTDRAQHLQNAQAWIGGKA